MAFRKRWSRAVQVFSMPWKLVAICDYVAEKQVRADTASLFDSIG